MMNCAREYLNALTVKPCSYQGEVLTSVAIGETGVRFIDGVVDARFVGVNSFIVCLGC